MSLRRPPVEVPFVPWAQWYPRFARDYRASATSADHVTIIGPTGTGKTVLAMQVAELRRYVVALGCKPKDDELRKLARAGGYRTQPTADLPSGGRGTPKLLVWPQYRGTVDRARQLSVFGDVLDKAFRVGGWHIVAEEAPHLVDLGLDRQLGQHLRMGRSMGSGLILCTQRPYGLGRYAGKLAISGAQHLLIFGTNDDDDLKRLSGMNGVSSSTVRECVGGLGRSYKFLHVDTRTGTLTVSRYDPPRKAPHP